MSLIQNRGNKIRTINEIKEGELYLISSPIHKDLLVKVTKQMSGSILASVFGESKNTQLKQFDWNQDFVMGEEEIYSVA